MRIILLNKQWQMYGQLNFRREIQQIILKNVETEKYKRTYNIEIVRHCILTDCVY